MLKDKQCLKIYAITDRNSINRGYQGRKITDAVEQAIIGGATIIQIREKQLNVQEFLDEAIEVKQITNKYNIPLIINDNVEVALACKADGVHIGQDDMNVIEARKILGDNAIIGVSATNLQEAIEAEKNGADYLGVGALFPEYMQSKPDAKCVSLEELRLITQSVKIPVVAIGGIKMQTIDRLKNTNIDGVAVISAIFANNDIVQATKEFVNATRAVIKN
ncbi:MAG: thiamine phosphate synthase [Rickettsiales bacterium]|nr:thiamine phosphate synthase [Rickettsiales bacterium]